MRWIVHVCGQNVSATKLTHTCYMYFLVFLLLSVCLISYVFTYVVADVSATFSVANKDNIICPWTVTLS